MNLSLGSRFAFFLLIFLFCVIRLPAQEVNCVIQKAPTDPAAQAFARHDYAKALDLYAAAAKSNPKDMEAIAGQVHSLLEEQNVSAAADVAEKSVASYPKSAVLATALGEVRFRQGRLSDAMHSYQISLQLDACLPRTRFDAYRLLWIESMHSSAYVQLQVANQLEPDDPDIRLAWIEHLPLAARAHDLDGYLNTAKDSAEDKQEDLKRYADRLHAILEAKNGGCRLMPSTATTTTLPFKLLMKDANRFYGVGFDVKINNKAQARLELDTGASGILLDRGAARKAGLVPVTSDSIGGLGDAKDMKGYWAYADDLRIGTLEFKNCMVEVSDKRSIVDTDGLIGADVFENYHVQLDFPLRQMTLSPLPARPGKIAVAHASLNASGVGDAAAASAPQNASTKATGETASLPSIHYTDRYVSPEMKSWSPFARFGHQILINGYLKDQQPRLFLLDSGANISILATPAAKSVGKIHGDSLDQVTGLNGRVDKIYTANNVDVIFAGLRDPFQQVLVMNLDSLDKSDGTDVSGIIGLDTLLMLSIDIDYRDGLIHLVYDPKHGKNVWLGDAR